MSSSFSPSGEEKKSRKNCHFVNLRDHRSMGMVLQRHKGKKEKFPSIKRRSESINYKYRSIIGKSFSLSLSFVTPPLSLSRRIQRDKMALSMFSSSVFLHPSSSYCSDEKKKQIVAIETFRLTE